MMITFNGERYCLINIIISAYLIFPFTLNIPGSNILHKFILFIMILYIFININPLLRMVLTNRKIKNNIIICLIGVFIWVICAIIFPIMYKTNDFSCLRYIKNTFTWVIHFLTIILMLRRRNYSSLCKAFMDMYIICCVFYVVISTLMIVIPSLKNVIFGIINISEMNLYRLKFARNATRIGWSGLTVYDGALKCTVGQVFTLSFLLPNSERFYHNKINRRVLWIYFSLLLLGNIYYARTGIVASIILIFVFLFLNLFMYGRIGRAIKISIGLVVALIGIYIVLENSLDPSTFEWMTGFINQFFQSKNISDLESIPQYRITSINEFLFGIGRYTIDTSESIYTDAGPMRLIYLFGIFPTVLVYMIIVNLLIRLNKACNKNSIISSFLFMFFLTTILFELKGDSYSFMLSIGVVLIFLIGDYLSVNKFRVIKE